MALHSLKTPLGRFLSHLGHVSQLSLYPVWTRMGVASTGVVPTQRMRMQDDWRIYMYTEGMNYEYCVRVVR